MAPLQRERRERVVQRGLVDQDIGVLDQPPRRVRTDAAGVAAVAKHDDGAAAPRHGADEAVRDTELGAVRERQALRVIQRALPQRAADAARVVAGSLGFGGGALRVDGAGRVRLLEAVADAGDGAVRQRGRGERTASQQLEGEHAIIIRGQDLADGALVRMEDRRRGRA